MHIPVAIAEFWKRFDADAGSVDPTRFYEAFHFGDNEELANSLADLVLEGTKRATAGSLWSFEHEGKVLPQPGDLSVVTNWAGSPLCVIETVQVDVVPFNEVTAEFAAVEGEGDGSLEFWRQEHASSFSRECARIGRVFNESMLVACERFRVVFTGSQGAAPNPSIERTSSSVLRTLPAAAHVQLAPMRDFYRRELLRTVATSALILSWRLAMGQSDRELLPRLVLPNLLWSMSEPIPQSISGLKDAVSDYAQRLGSKADLKELEVEFPRRSLDVHFSTWDRPSDTAGWIETKRIIPIRLAHDPSYAAILLELHKATHAYLNGSDKHFFEGLELLREGNVNGALPPAYYLCLGS